MSMRGTKTKREVDAKARRKRESNDKGRAKAKRLIVAGRGYGKTRLANAQAMALDSLRVLALAMRDEMDERARAMLEDILWAPDIVECLDALGWRHEDDIQRDALDEEQAREADEQEAGDGQD